MLLAGIGRESILKFVSGKWGDSHMSQVPSAVFLHTRSEHESTALNENMKRWQDAGTCSGLDPSHDNIHLPQLIYTNILKLLGGKESCTYMVDNIHISREMWASKSASRTLSTNPDILWLTEASWLAKKGNVSKIAAEYKMKSLLFGCLLGFIFKKDQVWMREFILKFIFKIIKASSQTADINI